MFRHSYRNFGKRNYGNIKLKPEQSVQRTVADFLRTAYPDLLWTASASGTGRIGIVAGTILKSIGYRKGCPDCFLFSPRGKYAGLHLELKSAGTKYIDSNGKVINRAAGKPTPEQLDWIIKANDAGYLAVVCTGADNAIRVITDYMNLPTIKK